MASFPLAGPVTRQKTIPSYLYVQYQDDDDLQAFVAAQNAATQAYVDWFNEVSLPVYTGLSGALLDWVGAGLYGMPRPILALRAPYAVGPFNTYTLNNIALNTRRVVNPLGFTLLNDDFYKRVLTWHFYIGDGKQFSIRWLKRRIARFLLGANGADVRADDTSWLSLRFSGASVQVSVDASGAPQMATLIMGVALSTGVLETPFHFTFSVRHGDTFITDGSGARITDSSGLPLTS